MSILGKALTVDGSCGAKTHEAAVKLADYYINQDDGFDTVKRYSSGKWVYVIQGLLYCHGYDPKGFDGNYGVSGGTGCLNAVNSFKRDNGLLNDNNGDVTAEVLSALLWGHKIPGQTVELPYYDDSLILSFAAFSDIHINGSDLGDKYAYRVKKAIDDISKLSVPVDLTCITGDLTETAEEYQYRGLAAALADADLNKMILTLGNHDSGVFAVCDFDTAFALYSSFYGKNKPYFDTWINGIHFIVISSEAQLQDNAYISDEQLEWLKEKLDEDADDEKPIFVLCHWPLKSTHLRTETDTENIGEQSDQVLRILSDYPQVIYLSGHVHNGFNEQTYIRKNNVNFVSLPTLKGGSYGYNTEYSYYYVQVYPNQVRFYARDFERKIWLHEYDITVDLPYEAKPGFFLKDGYVMNIPLNMPVYEFYEQMEESYEPVDFTDENRVVCTGYTIKDTRTGEEYRISIKCDVNGDGRLTSADYLKVRKYFTGEIDLTGCYFRAADIDDNGSITSLDYVYLKSCFK